MARTNSNSTKGNLLKSRISSANVSFFPEAALGYFLGPLLALVANAIVNTYLVQYWDKVLDLGTWASLFQTLLPICSSIVIIIGNLLVGRLMNRKPSIAGKARPLILIGMPLIAASLLMLFMVPFPYNATKDNPSIVALVMISIGYILYYAVAYPFYYTSHSALVSLSTRDGNKRSLLATLSNAAQLGAAGLAGMIGPFIVKALNILPYDKENNQVMDEVTRANANSKWFIVMIVMICCLVIGSLIEFIFTRERITEEKIKLDLNISESETAYKKNVSTSTQAKVCIHDKYWWMIIIFYFLYQLSGMLKNNDGTWFSQSFTGDVALSGTINTIGAIPTALGMFIIWPLARKYGKANCIKVGAIIATVTGCLGFLCIPYANNSGIVSAISITTFCLKALGTAPAMYISLALLSDILDHQEAKTGIRTDGFTMAVYGSIMVAMPGIANGIIVGLKSIFSSIEQLQVLHTFLFFGSEVFCYFLIFIIFMFLKVEKFSKEDREIILNRQKEECLASGKEWIEPQKRMEIEEEEIKKVIEEERITKLKEKCQKKNLNFEDEEKKYQDNLIRKAQKREKLMNMFKKKKVDSKNKSSIESNDEEIENKNEVEK